MVAFQLQPRYPFKPTLASIPALDQYLLLSMLVHVLIILLFGDAGNGIRGGQRIWGAMNVTLQDLLPGQGGVTAPTLKTDTRLASIDRIRESRRPSNPAAAKPGAAMEPAATPASEPAAVPPEPLPADTPPAQPAPRVIATEVDKPVTGFVVPLPSPAGEPSKAGKVADVPLPELPIRRAAGIEPVPGVPIAPIPTLKTEQELAIPAQLKLREQAAPPPLAPVSTIAPSPGEREYVRANALPKLPAIAAPAATSLAPDKIDRQLASPQLPIPKLAPIEAPSTALAAPATIDRELTTPLAPLPRMAPVAIPTVEAIAPARIDRTLAAPNASLPPLPQIAQPAAASVAPARIEREFIAPAPAAGAGEISTKDARSTEIRTDRNAAPAATGAAVGQDGAAASTGQLRDAKPPLAGIGPGNAPESVKSAPALGLESLRQRARELAAEGTGPRTALPFPTAPKPPAKTSAQQAFDKALKRPDCKDAYSGMGLAAVVPLLLDAVTENGCKW